jgi:hypothetical protein
MPSTDDSDDCQESCYEATFDPTAGDRASEVIVRAIEATTGSDPLGLEPLYEAINPDALDALCEHTRSAADAIALRFSYAGYDVDVRTDGQVRVFEPSGATAE